MRDKHLVKACLGGRAAFIGRDQGPGFDADALSHRDVNGEQNPGLTGLPRCFAGATHSSADNRHHPRKRMMQYSKALVMKPKGRAVLKQGAECSYAESW